MHASYTEYSKLHRESKSSKIIILVGVEDPFLLFISENGWL